MAKIGDICDRCGRVIKSYPIYGRGTCHTCRYERYVADEAPVLKSNIDNFFKKRIEEDYDVESIDFLLSKFVELLPKMKDEDVVAIIYILNSIENRWD